MEKGHFCKIRLCMDIVKNNFADQNTSVHRQLNEFSACLTYLTKCHQCLCLITGLRVEYDLNKPNGKRVTKALARCGECRVPIYEPVDPKRSYYVIMTAFVANGGDGFKILKNNYRREQEMGMFTTHLIYWTLQFLGTVSLLHGKAQVIWNNSTKLKLHS
jgi:hypothetical protein